MRFDHNRPTRESIIIWSIQSPGKSEPAKISACPGHLGQARFRHTVIFKVAFSTFWFKFGATRRRQVERRDSGTRQKASNLAQPIS